MGIDCVLEAARGSALWRVRRRAAVALLLAGLGLTLATGAWAATPAGSADFADPADPANPAPPGPAALAAEVPEPPADELERGTPRSAMRGFLVAAREDDWPRAARFLQLGPVPSAQRASRGPELARQLKQVLDRNLWVDLEALSDDPRGERDDGLPADRDRVGRIEGESRTVDVYLDRVAGDEGVRIWKVSAATVARVPALYDELGVGFLEGKLPAPLVKWRLLEIALWQWIALLALLTLAYLVAWGLARSVARVASLLASRSTTTLDDRLLDLAVGPVRLLLTVGGVTVGSAFLGLAVPARQMLANAEALATLFGFTWLLFRVVDFVSEVVDGNMRERSQQAALGFVPMGRRALKIGLGLMAGLAALDTFGFDVTALIAGLGVGGLAVALAAQKTLENIFGGVTVLTDQPVHVGDFCRFGDRVGTVEEIGIRSTRLRTTARTVVTVPNADFSSMHLENFGKRDRMLLETTLGLRYETRPEQLRWVLVELRRLLYAHPKVLHDPARVRFAGFGASSLDVDIWCYVATRDWNEFLAVREDLFLRMMDVVAEGGSGFAFPSTTTYLAKDDGLDDELSRAAEARVAEWREKNELMLPDWSPDGISAVDDSLDFPPRGSATG